MTTYLLLLLVVGLAAILLTALRAMPRLVRRLRAERTRRRLRAEATLTDVYLRRLTARAMAQLLDEARRGLFGPRP